MRCGVGCFTVTEIPTCPCSLAPQQNTLPCSVRAHACADPSASSTSTAGGGGGGGGSGLGLLHVATSKSTNAARRMTLLYTCRHDIDQLFGRIDVHPVTRIHDST